MNALGKARALAPFLVSELTFVLIAGCAKWLFPVAPKMQQCWPTTHHMCVGAFFRVAEIVVVMVGAALRLRLQQWSARRGPSKPAPTQDAVVASQCRLVWRGESASPSEVDTGAAEDVSQVPALNAMLHHAGDSVFVRKRNMTHGREWLHKWG